MEENINDFKNLKNSIMTLDKILKYLPEKENRLNTIPRIFNKTYDENFISDFLAYILNPAYNGIGIEPLLRIVEDYSLKATSILNSLTMAEENEIEVIREYTFGNGRRIDILIIIQDLLVIGIENKIFSGELNNQTIDYANSISDKFSECETVLLFLTPKKSIPSSNEFEPVSYKELSNKLTKVKFDYQEDIRRRVIYDEFILHIREYMMKKKSDNISNQTKLYLEYKDTIEKLNKYFERDSLMVFEEFEGVLKNSFDDGEWEFSIKSDRKYHQVYKTHWSMKGLFIHYEFWVSGNNILTRPDMYLMVDVEGRNRELFLTEFEKEYPELENYFTSNNISYRPDNRKNAIAHKIFENYFKPDYKEENMLPDEISKFRFLDEVIDDVLERIM